MGRFRKEAKLFTGTSPTMKFSFGFTMGQLIRVKEPKPQIFNGGFDDIYYVWKFGGLLLG